MPKLLTIESKKDIPEDFQGSPIADLLSYHNLGEAHRSYEKAELLIGTCMDHRVGLNLPKKFAYVIRTGGANLKYNSFHISYAIGVGGVKHIALIEHTHCGMADLSDCKEMFIEGLISNAGWDKERAEDHFNRDALDSDIVNEEDFILNQTEGLRAKYPKVMVAPLIYKVEDHKLYWIS